MVVEFYNRLYRRNPRKWVSPERNEFAYYVIKQHVVRPRTFLDVGCGNGHTIEFFLKQWPDTRYYGIDLSDVAIEIAQQKVPTQTFICSTFDSVDIPKCDLVTIMGVAEHFEDLPAGLARLRESGTWVYMECPNCLKMEHSQVEGFRTTSGSSGQIEWHLFRRTWEEHIINAGFDIIVSIDGIGPAVEFVWLLR